eukprot:TRINITY_DN32161_c0_g1_i12.p1 TRINITY_DN32161_c0_g1~~TRINITY_DN32161_c0_g1_i12.p1  ORF type:complete len:802 (-),score=250.97 TRINITY_DN32161_c0_g1_i12:1075-3480(-)
MSTMSTEEVLRLKTLCLAHSEVKLPRADEHAALLFNGLGARRWQISLHCDSLSFRKAILSIYPRLKTVNGYNLWFVNKEKRFQVVPEKVNNPRRIKHFLSSFKAECLLIIPVTNIQLMEENLEKLEKRNEELSNARKNSFLKDREDYVNSPLCLICGSTGGGCDGALETVDSVMQESSKIADKIFNFLGTHGGGGKSGGVGADGGKCSEEYRGKKICRRCLIAATELSDMEDSTDNESRYTSGDDGSCIAKEDCQTQPLDFSNKSCSSSSEGPPSPTPSIQRPAVAPPPSSYVYPFSSTAPSPSSSQALISTTSVAPHYPHKLGIGGGGGSTNSIASLALCNPIYTRKGSTTTTAVLHPMAHHNPSLPQQHQSSRYNRSHPAGLATAGTRPSKHHQHNSTSRSNSRYRTSSTTASSLPYPPPPQTKVGHHHLQHHDREPMHAPGAITPPPQVLPSSYLIDHDYNNVVRNYMSRHHPATNTPSPTSALDYPRDGHHTASSSSPPPAAPPGPNSPKSHHWLAAANGGGMHLDEAALSAQLYLAHKSANLNVPGLYSGLLAARHHQQQEHHHQGQAVEEQRQHLPPDHQYHQRPEAASSPPHAASPYTSASETAAVDSSSSPAAAAAVAFAAHRAAAAAAAAAATFKANTTTEEADSSSTSLMMMARARAASGGSAGSSDHEHHGNNNIRGDHGNDSPDLSSTSMMEDRRSPPAQQPIMEDDASSTAAAAAAMMMMMDDGGRHSSSSSRHSPIRDGLNSTGTGSPGASSSSGASSDFAEEDAANEKRKPMKKRKFSSTGLSSDN